MHSALIAEWLLARFMGRKQAASIVGDLLELKQLKGNLWFWYSLVGVVIVLFWRRPLAFVAALIFGFMAFAGLQATDIMGIPPLLSGNYNYPWMNLCWVLFAILLFVLTYATIRYGLRDRVTQLALALSISSALLIYGGRQMAVLVACIVFLVCVAAVSILNTERRRAAVVILIVESVGIVGGLWAAHVFNLFFDLAVPMSKRAPAPPSAGWLYLCMVLMMAWMMATACSCMHNWLMRNSSIDLGD